MVGRRSSAARVFSPTECLIMTNPDHSPWDFIVIGAGLAGSVAAAELGRAGHRVLVLERGTGTGPEPAPRRSTLAKIKSKLFPSEIYYGPGRMRQTMNVTLSQESGCAKALEFPVMLGTGPGGSSEIYSAALGRFRQADFEEDTGRKVGALANNWPVSFQSFQTHYEAAERLMRVYGTPDPLDPDDQGEALLTPPAIGPRDLSFVERLRTNGFNPYRLHVGFDYLPGCAECMGVPCARACKATGFSRALQPALEEQKVFLRTGQRVLRILQDQDGLGVLSEGPDGVAKRIACGHVIVAAGALKTPALLGASPGIWPQGVLHPMLGRGLMFHGGDILAVHDPAGAARFGPQKTLGLRDFYRDGETPLGEVQSFAAPITTTTVASYLMDEAHRRGFGWLGPALQLARIPAAIGMRLFAKASLFAANMEDLPYARNRVVVEEIGEGFDPDKVSIEYTVPAEMKDRARRFRVLMREAFAPFRVDFLAALATPNWGHSCGTVRMGEDRDAAVTTPMGQLWDNPDITVVDASTFPSSGGANPSLTIVANALRVSQALAGKTFR